MYKYDCSQCFNIQDAIRECNDRGMNGWKLHSILAKGKGEKLVYTMIFEKSV